MNKKEFRKYCEKQIEMCIKLHDEKHLREHELALGLLNENERLIQQKNKYKEVIDSAKALVNNVYNSLENADKPIKFYEELLDILNINERN